MLIYFCASPKPLGQGIRLTLLVCFDNMIRPLKIGQPLLSKNYGGAFRPGALNIEDEGGFDNIASHGNKQRDLL